MAGASDRPRATWQRAGLFPCSTRAGTWRSSASPSPCVTTTPLSCARPSAFARGIVNCRAAGLLRPASAGPALVKGGFRSSVRRRPPLETERTEPARATKSERLAQSETQPPLQLYQRFKLLANVPVYPPTRRGPEALL